MTAAPRSRSGELIAVLTVVLASVVLCGPVLFERGYVLVGDMTFVPDQPWKPAWLGLDGSVPRAVPADAVVSVVGQLVAGDLLQKSILLGTVVMAGLGVLRLSTRVATASVPPRIGGAVLYVWNPFVFERLAIGHWGLLVGYAALPWVTAAALDLRRDAPAAIGRLVLLLAVAAAGSPTGGVVAGLVAVMVTAGRDRLRRTAVVLGAVALVNLPWLAPGVLNDAAASDSTGVAAFAARSDSPLGVWGSLLTFGGIWKQAVVPDERQGALLSTAALVLAAVSLAALVAVSRRGIDRALAPGRLIALGVVGLVLAGLPAVGPGERLVTELVEVVPGAGLWRDSQKWLMPFVLVTCLGFVLVLDALDRRLRRLEVPALVPTLGLALVPVALLPSLAWGLSGRLEPTDYPREWEQVRVVLERQPAADRRTAVLPWSAYQRLPWNHRRAALDPALRFFPGEILASEDLTVSETVTVRGEDRTSDRIGRAIAAREPLAQVLAEEGVRYLLVEKTAPSAMDVPLPEGTVLHDGSELLLLDLGNGARTGRAPYPGLIIAADVLAVLGVLAGAVLVIRRKPGAGVGYDARGSSINGGAADSGTDNR